MNFRNLSPNTIKKLFKGKEQFPKFFRVRSSEGFFLRNDESFGNLRSNGTDCLIKTLLLKEINGREQESYSRDF